MQYFTPECKVLEIYMNSDSFSIRWTSGSENGWKDRNYKGLLRFNYEIIT